MFKVQVTLRGTERVVATHEPGFTDIMAARGHGRMMADECYEYPPGALQVEVDTGKVIQCYDADCLDTKGKLYSWPVKPNGDPV